MPAHGTATGATSGVCRIIERLSCVKRILVGKINPKGGTSVRSVKIKPLAGGAGLLLTVSGDGVQEVRIYTDNIAEAEKQIASACTTLRLKIKPSGK